MIVDQVLRQVEVVAALGVGISSLEFLAHPKQVDDESLLSWQVAQLRYRVLTAGPFHRILDLLFAGRRILAAYAVRLVAVVLLLVDFGSGPLRAALSVVIVLTTVAGYARTSFGTDGADQMTVVTFGALAIARATGGALVPVACLWFLALQVCLSYLSAGVHKILSPWWRSKQALTGVLSTSAYGALWARSLLLSRPRLAILLGWLIVAWEVSFPAALLLPDPYPWVFVITGVGFHGATAVIMGLNSFFWAFVATYPALLFCAGSVATRG